MRRAVIATVLCLLAVVTVPVVPVVAQTPEATPGAEEEATELPFPPWRVLDTRELEIDGEPVALSPDGRWIAGIGPDGGSICVWNVQTLAPTCKGEDLTIQTLPLTGSIAWAPDSSAVAFVNGISQLLQPTDVMLFDLEHRSLHNLTLTSLSGKALLHTGPSWTADSNWIVFAETDPSGSEGQPASIIYYNRQFKTAVPVPLEDEFYIRAPVVVMPDDSVLFRVDPSPVGTSSAGIWRVEPDGENLTQVLSGEDDAPIDAPVVLGVSADGDWLSVASATAIERQAPGDAFFLVEVESGDVRKVELPDDGEVVSQPVFGQYALFALVQDGAGPGIALLVMDPDTGEAQRLEGVSLHESWLLTPATWATNGTALIPMDGGGLLITLDQDPETFPAE